MIRMNAAPQSEIHRQRWLEVACGLVPFLFLGLIILTSRFWLTLAAVIILAYAIGWLVRIVGFAYRLGGAYYTYKLATLIDWRARLVELTVPAPTARRPRGFWARRAEAWYGRLLARGATADDRLDPSQLYQALIVTMYTEPYEVLAATLQAIAASDYDHARMLVIIAYEARGGTATEAAAKRLAGEYADRFKLVQAVKHPATIAGEAKVKAANITYAAQWLSAYCREQHILPAHVLVTTLDSDNKPHRQYLAALAWRYATTADRLHRSYQPLPLYTNNIWDAPAPVRVVASDTSFWFMMESRRPRRLRLFSAYAQNLQTLEAVNYWNVRTVVEDGHQYWRSYFAFHGNFAAVPIWLPIFQDAVLTGSYWQTLVAQFRQLLRWGWGVSDTPFVIRQALADTSITWRDKLLHIYRQVDDYMTWSTAPIVLAIGGWLPRLVQADTTHSLLAGTMFRVFAIMQLLALGLFAVAVVVYVALLPPRPARYGRLRNAVMLLQWVLEPITLVVFFSLSSLTAHARLLLGKPLERFDVTTKTAISPNDGT